jgi:hypothetical protein
MPTSSRGVWALAALLLSPLSALALDVEVEVGLGGFLAPGSWTPVRVSCQLGPGEERLEGRVVLDLPRQAIASCSAPLDLEPGQMARVTLAAPVGIASGDYRVRVEDAEGRTLAEEVPEETWTVLGDDQHLVLLLGRPSLQAFRSERDLLPRTVHLAPEALPREPRVLASADAIFLKGDRSAGLRELARDAEVVAALRRYVMGGGHLVVLADQPEQTQPFWLEQPLKDLLPVSTVRGQLELPPARLEPAFGGVPSGPVWALDVVQSPGASPPLCVGRALGLGRVSVVTCDVDHPLLRPISGTTGFLVNLVRRPKLALPRLRDEELTQSSRAVFQATPLVSSMGMALIISCVALHLIALGPLTSYVTRRRSPWAGLAVPPAVSVLLAITIVVVASLLRGPPRARALVYTFQDPEATQVWAQVDVGLFAGHSEDFRLTLSDTLRPRPQPRPSLDSLRFRRPAPVLEFVGSLPHAIAPIHVTARGHTWLELSADVETTSSADLTPPPIRASLEPTEGDWPRIKIAYKGDEPLAHVLLLGIGLAETRLEVVQLEPGAELVWRPQAGAVLGPPPTLEEDPFESPSARTRLLLTLAERLERERHRAAAAASPLERVAFPAYWVVTLRRTASGSFALEGDQHGALDAEHLQAAFLPAREQP